MKIKLLTLVLTTVLIYFLYQFFFNTVDYAFPFSKSENVELVFYEKEFPDGVDLEKIYKVPFSKKVKLNESEKEELFEILFKETCFVEFPAACYNPRHALVFTTDKDTIGVIEICLECAGIRETEGIEHLKMCGGKIEKLDTFFKARE
jgi:hypothetical protein